MSDQSRQRRYQNLVEGYSGWLYRYAYWITGDATTAEDLVQETFLRAWRFLDGLQEESAAKSWLTTILRRENARRFERKQLDYSDVELDTVPTDNQTFDARPEVLALRNALQHLPVKYREPLLLQVIDGYTLDEIAEQFDLPRNTVATRLHRARQKLRKHLEGEELLIADELS
ncbi:MAG: sigma-70 family RNA polymerase sigma factor [Pseudomonadales bacterium]|nr:sigma-70 family RNA polymerase sigma factor [Pseudomonadales bacterium]